VSSTRRGFFRGLIAAAATVVARAYAPAAQVAPYDWSGSFTRYPDGPLCALNLSDYAQCKVEWDPVDILTFMCKDAGIDVEQTQRDAWRAVLHQNVEVR